MMRALARWVLAALCTQGPVAALMFSGWAERVAGRAARAVLGETEEPWPSMVVGEEGRWRWVSALGTNLRRGLRTSLGIGLYTWPIGALWWFAWRYGWDASFFKSYENAHLGPLMGVLGLLSFASVMLFVPLAAARAALIDDRRAFLQPGLLLRLAVQRPFEAAGVAAAHLVASGPFTVMWIAPVLIVAARPELAAAPVEDAAAWLRRYYLFWGVLAVPVVLGLRILAARWYGRALRDAAAVGSVGAEELHAEELARVEVGTAVRRPLRWALVSPVLAVAFGLWMAVGATPFVGAFFHYRDIGWFNQPLVQVPWFRYMPESLRDR